MLDKIQKMIDSLSEDEFFYYIDPFSYYNSSLSYSISLKTIVQISNYKSLLNLYFELKKIEQDLLEVIYDKITDYLDTDEYEDEQISINWIPIILNILNSDIEIYHKIICDYDKELLNLIEINESVENDNYIINNSDEKISFYSKDIIDVISYIRGQGLIDLDWVEKIYKSEDFKPKFASHIEMSKNGDILYSDYRVLDIKQDQDVKNIVTQIRRNKTLVDLLGEKRIFNFNQFHFSHLT